MDLNPGILEAALAAEEPVALVVAPDAEEAFRRLNAEYVWSFVYRKCRILGDRERAYRVIGRRRRFELRWNEHY